MDVPSQRQAEPPTRGFFLRAETEEPGVGRGRLQAWGSVSSPDSAPEHFASDRASLWDPWLNNETKYI